MRASASASGSGSDATKTAAVSVSVPVSVPVSVSAPGAGGGGGGGGGQAAFDIFDQPVSRVRASASASANDATKTAAVPVSVPVSVSVVSHADVDDDVALAMRKLSKLTSTGLHSDILTIGDAATVELDAPSGTSQPTTASALSLAQSVISPISTFLIPSTDINLKAPTHDLLSNTHSDSDVTSPLVSDTFDATKVKGGSP